MEELEKVPIELKGSANLLHAFSRPARKNAANRNLLRQNFIAYIFRSKSARARARERKSKNKREKKHGKTPSLLRRIILRLGCITP